MKPFFSTPERLALLEREATSWIGTPFVPHACIKGAGADCVNPPGKTLVVCGHLKDFTLPRYSMDGGKHNAESQLNKYLDGHTQFACVWRRGEPRVTASPGDIFTLKSAVGNRSAHHAGLVYKPGQVIHCLFQRKIVSWSIADPVLQRLLDAIYRPIEVPGL